MDEEMIFDEALPPEDDAEQLALDENRRRREGRADDVVSMQTVVCLLIAGGIVLLGMAQPELAGKLVDLIKALSTDSKHVIPNPIDTIIAYFSA